MSGERSRVLRSAPGTLNQARPRLAEGREAINAEKDETPKIKNKHAFPLSFFRAEKRAVAGRRQHSMGS